MVNWIHWFSARQCSGVTRVSGTRGRKQRSALPIAGPSTSSRGLSTMHRRRLAKNIDGAPLVSAEDARRDDRGAVCAEGWGEGEGSSPTMSAPVPV